MHACSYFQSLIVSFFFFFNIPFLALTCVARPLPLRKNCGVLSTGPPGNSSLTVSFVFYCPRRLSSRCKHCSKGSQVPDPSRSWVDLASLESSGNFHLGSRVCGGKQLSSVSQASSASDTDPCVLWSTDHGHWRQADLGPNSICIIYQGHDSGFGSRVEHYSVNKCLLVFPVSLEDTLLCQGLTLQFLDLRRPGEFLKKRLEAVACYQLCRSILGG